MAHPTPIDISTIPDLARIVEEVEATRKPRELRRDNKPVAQTGKTARHKAITKADHEAFLSAVGGWKDLVDTEQLKKDIYESRKIATRPPVKL
jgi:hypothetical protein